MNDGGLLIFSEKTIAYVKPNRSFRAALDSFFGQPQKLYRNRGNLTYVNVYLHASKF
jgi:hypothetical protein